MNEKIAAKYKDCSSRVINFLLEGPSLQPLRHYNLVVADEGEAMKEEKKKRQVKKN